MAEAAAAAKKDEGNSKFKAELYEEAIELYTSAIELDPNMHVSYSNRSACYVKLKKYEEALADGLKCVELMPSWEKGYNRVAAAYQGLKEWDKAIEICRVGIENTPGDSLQKMIEEVSVIGKRDDFIRELQGSWHGKVNEVIGGYDQAMEFDGNKSVTVTVLGRASPGTYWVDAAKDPKHLTIQMQPPSQPGMPYMPPVPPVPYIARIDESGLHLCCPYMKMERPTEFVGPGYCLMKKGKLVVEDTSSDLKDLGRIERLRLCAQELTKKLPNTKLEEPSPTDSEEQASEKLMAQVRFESSMYETQQRFGEDCVKEVIEASRGMGSLDVRQLKEIEPMIKKLKVCGLIESDEPQPEPSIASLASSGPKVQGPPAESKKSAPSDKVESRRGEADPDSGSSDVDTATVAVALVAVAAVASFVYVLWRRQRR